MSDTTTTSSFVIEVTAQNFQQDVIERSHSVPVVIDFWATWCGPCRMLGPVLEKLAQEYDGKFVLAKIDTDTESELARQFGVRSIPAVFGVRDGKAVDGFVGVQPESVIRAWIDRLLPTPAETLAAEASSLEQSDPQAAEEKYSAAVAIDPELIASTDRAGANRHGTRSARGGPGTDPRAGAPRFSRARSREDQGRADAPAPGRTGRQRRGRTRGPGRQSR